MPSATLPRMISRRDFLQKSALACGAVWLAGCAKRESAAGRAIREGILLRGNGTEPESLDPQTVRGAAEWTIMAALYEGLTVLDPATLAPVPGTAERWTVSPDGLTYTFTLRTGLQWSNGDALTAEDFVWSARRLITPELASAHVEDTLAFVRGVTDFAAGRTGDFSTVGIRATDARTVEFTLSHPTPFFPSALVLFYPVHRASIEGAGAVTDRGAAWTRPGAMVSNGPFALARWQPNLEVAVVKNPRYWDAARVQLSGVTFFPFENPATEETAFRNGQLHLTSSLPLQKFEVYQREAPDLLQVVPDLGNYFYTFNVTAPPFNDPRVRQALSLATDRESLVRNVIRGGKQAATAFTPPNLGGYTAHPRLRFDAAAARALLAAAGFPGGAGFPRVELLIDSRDFHRVIAEALQQMWRRELGVAVELRNEETRSLIASKRAMQFGLVRGSWNANAYQDPWFFLGPWVTGGLYNEARWSSPAYDALLGRAQRTAAPAERLDWLRQAEDVLLEEMPVLPLYWGTQVFLKSRAVTGYSGRPFGDRSVKWLGLA